MKVYTEEFSVRTQGKGTYEISDEIRAIVSKSGITNGQVTVFLQHGSANRPDHILQLLFTLG